MPKRERWLYPMNIISRGGSTGGGGIVFRAVGDIAGAIPAEGSG